MIISSQKKNNSNWQKQKYGVNFLISQNEIHTLHSPQYTKSLQITM